MDRRHGHPISLIFLLCDLTVTTAAWFGAYFLRFTLWPSEFDVPDVRLVVDGLPLVLVAAVVAFRLFGLYEVHRLREFPRELGGICRASGLLFLLAITAVFYRRDFYESRLAFGLFFVLNTVSLVVARRIVWRVVKRWRSRRPPTDRAVIVGSGRTGRLVAQTIKNNSWTGLQAIGFVDAPSRFEPSLLPRLGTIDQLGEIVEAHHVTHVFVALPLSRYGEMPAVQRAMGDLMVDVQLVPDLPHLTGLRVRNLEIDEMTFLSLRSNPHYGWRRVAKRTMDVAFGAAALVILAPVMLLLAALVKLSSPGPVLFRQSRTGLGGKDFQMLKFRSMRIDAEHGIGPVWAKRNDRRCTRLGGFMRRWSLDELPQLFNVLMGDMSLVGPRPERAVFIEKFRAQLPTYAQRHQVKAGITGWAQVNGWRGNTSLRRRLECDLYYISNWSLWLDLKILALTVLRGFRHRNAY